MNYLQIKELIKLKLPLEDKKIVEDIEDIIKNCSSEGEISSKVGFYLKHLDKTNYKVYVLLKDEIKEYIQSCEKMGLQII